VPFRQIVEDGLRAVIQREKQSRLAFKLRDGSFGGKGARAGLSWPAVRQAIYEGPRRMIAVDTNILVYAHRRDSEWHEPAFRCLASLAEGQEL